VARNVFVLGAGASRQAGGPLMSDFLDRAFDAYHHDPSARDLVRKGESALRAVYANANLDLRNVESLWSAFEMARLIGNVPGLSSDETSGLVGALKTLVASTVDRCVRPQSPNSDFPYPPEPYLAFVQDVLFDLQSYAVLSFNYDTALETALGFDAGRPRMADWNQPWDVPRILKLHGSLHWTRCAVCRELVKVPWSDVYGGLHILQRLGGHVHCDQPCEASPVIVPPTWSKHDFHMGLQGVWQQAGRELAEARNIFVIGYSLSPSDQFFRDLFGLGTIGARLRRVWIIDPDPHPVEARWRQLLGPDATRYLRSLQLTFAAAIPVLRTELRAEDQYD
jgi:hypothetical protein